jgi:hypothetical protein
MRNEVLDNFVIKFIENHFKEINLKKLDWSPKNKKEAIAEIKAKDFMAGWIITEVMSWGTETDYQKDIIVDNDEDHFIIKIEGRYFAIDHDHVHYFNEVFPEKIVIEKIVYKPIDEKNVGLDA